LSARLVAWCALIAICLVIVLGAYFVMSSSLSFFESEASKVASKPEGAPQLRSAVEQALQFTTSFTWTVFALLAVALVVSLAALWLESLASR
jgi:flagellar basal body-associated protein FliL